MVRSKPRGTFQQKRPQQQSHYHRKVTSHGGNQNAFKILERDVQIQTVWRRVVGSKYWGTWGDSAADYKPICEKESIKFEFARKPGQHNWIPPKKWTDWSTEILEEKCEQLFERIAASKIGIKWLREEKADPDKKIWWDQRPCFGSLTLAQINFLKLLNCQN